MATLEGKLVVYYWIQLISCQQRLGTRPGGLGETHAVTLSFSCCVRRQGQARPCLRLEGRQITVAYFALAELELVAAKHDFGSDLPNTFLEMGIHTF